MRRTTAVGEFVEEVLDLTSLASSDGADSVAADAAIAAESVAFPVGVDEAQPPVAATAEGLAGAIVDSRELEAAEVAADSAEPVPAGAESALASPALVETEAVAAAPEVAPLEDPTKAAAAVEAALAALAALEAPAHLAPPDALPEWRLLADPLALSPRRSTSRSRRNRWRSSSRSSRRGRRSGNLRQRPRACPWRRSTNRPGRRSCPPSWCSRRRHADPDEGLSVAMGEPPVALMRRPRSTRCRAPTSRQKVRRLLPRCSVCSTRLSVCRKRRPRPSLPSSPRRPRLLPTPTSPPGASSRNCCTTTHGSPLARPPRTRRRGPLPTSSRRNRLPSTLNRRRRPPTLRK